MFVRQYPNSRADRRGAAAVELAILLPILCFFFVLAVDYARVFYFTMVVTNCARGGALYGSEDPTKANDTSGIQTEALRDAGNLDTTQMTITSTTDSATTPTYVTVTASYPFSTISNFPGIASTTTISRSCKMTVTPWIPN